MLVGWGGNNGSTVTASVLANKMNISWRTKEGRKYANYYGSLTQATTIRMGSNDNGKEVRSCRLLRACRPGRLTRCGCAGAHSVPQHLADGQPQRSGHWRLGHQQRQHR